MTKRRLPTFLTALFLLGFVNATPSFAQDNACGDMPSGAAKALPSPLRKWAKIVCTPFGQMVSSRDGWVWASLEDAAAVSIVAGAAPQDTGGLGDASYFVKIDVSELQQDESAVALTTFDSNLPLKNRSSKVYRVDLTVAGGLSTTLLLIDFGSFAGGMFCPDGSCVLDSRFLIMQREHPDLINTAAKSSAARRGRAW